MVLSKNRQYSAQDLNHALSLVENEHKSLYSASKATGVPWSTLKDYLHREDKSLAKLGRPFALPPSKRNPKVDVAVISNLGTILELNGYVYKKTDEYTNDGARWVCGVEKCHAFLIMNDDDEIISAKELHSHAARKKWKMTAINDKSKGELVTSRNGNQNLMYRRFAYRKKYTRGDKIRWVCATMKYCRACLHTNESLLVLKAYQEHCHAPPKYNYNK